MGETPLAGRQASLPTVGAGRFTLISPVTASAFGALVLALMAAEIAMSLLARDFAASDNGAGPAAILVYAAVGVLGGTAARQLSALGR